MTAPTVLGTIPLTPCLGPQESKWLGVVAHICNPSTLEAKAGESLSLKLAGASLKFLSTCLKKSKKTKITKAKEYK
jgi:hypothetical protein